MSEFTSRDNSAGELQLQKGLQWIITSLGPLIGVSDMINKKNASEW